MNASPFGTEKDVWYMKQALEQAQIAALHDEVPVGAIVVNSQGEIIARSYNASQKLCTQAAHAEMNALRIAGEHVRDWRLQGCWLYVTLEPCLMCMGLIYLSRIEGMAYGASSPLFGPRLDNNTLLPVYKVDTLRIISQICALEASHMLKKFFQQKRKASESAQ